MTREPRAVFSDCTVHTDPAECSPSCAGRLYRYVLAWPTGVTTGPKCDMSALGIFANPSTADTTRLDPTLTRWRNYCRDWGYGWSVTCNVLAWRSTDPKLAPRDGRALGLLNYSEIAKAAKKADLVVCGWGNLDQGEGVGVLRMLRSIGTTPHALKLTKTGAPCHPLYLRSDLKPFPMVGS